MLEDLESLRLYKKYLNTLQTTLDKYFDEQKEYLCCSAGCSKCCEIGEYPYSKIEFDYLMSGFFRLERNVQMDIAKRINQLKTEYEKVDNKKHYMYRCPFLDENSKCTIYEYRGIICRTFGLIQRNPDDTVTLPFCYEFGLNYSKVYDPKTKKIDYDKVKIIGYNKLPIDYNIGLGFLINKDIFVNEKFQFGEIKPLIEFLLSP